MKKIAVFGIGGVGGYFGGFLAKHYGNSDSIEIVFIARGENKRMISENGLRLETYKGNFISFPKKVASDPTSIGKVDFLICSVKNYDIEKSALLIQPCISPKTIILPLMNGFDGQTLIKSIFPENEVWNSCVYLVSELVEPGMVRQKGNMEFLFFGSMRGSQNQMQELENIFLQANINAFISDDIDQTIWIKFIFIATLATITSFLNACIGKILSDETSRNQVQLLLTEIKLVAEAKNILLSADIIMKTMEKLEGLPYETTSSMHTDFLRGKKTELESLTGFVVKTSQQCKLNTPTFNLMYDSLVKINS